MQRLPPGRRYVFRRQCCYTFCSSPNVNMVGFFCAHDFFTAPQGIRTLVIVFCFQAFLEQAFLPLHFRSREYVPICQIRRKKDLAKQFCTFQQKVFLVKCKTIIQKRQGKIEHLIFPIFSNAWCQIGTIQLCQSLIHCCCTRICGTSFGQQVRQNCIFCRIFLQRQHQANRKAAGFKTIRFITNHTKPGKRVFYNIIRIHSTPSSMGFCPEKYATILTQNRSFS